MGKPEHSAYRTVTFLCVTVSLTQTRHMLMPKLYVTCMYFSYHCVCSHIIVQYLLQCCYFCASSQDRITPLYRASQKGHSNIVDVLLKAGGDPNITDQVSPIIII